MADPNQETLLLLGCSLPETMISQDDVYLLDFLSFLFPKRDSKPAMRSFQKSVPVQAYRRAGVQETNTERDEKDKSQKQTLWTDKKWKRRALKNQIKNLF